MMLVNLLDRKYVNVLNVKCWMLCRNICEKARFKMHKVRFNDTHQLNAILFNPNWVLMTTCVPTQAHRFLKISGKCHTANPSLMLDMNFLGYCPLNILWKSQLY